LLTPGASGADLKLRIKEAQVKVFGDELARVVELDLVPLRDVYLRNQIYPVPNGSDIFYVRVFLFTAMLVLVIAAMNYVNMTTARSLVRAREVGVRKVMGALRPELFRQFLAESLLTTALAVMAAIMLAGIMLPLFSQLAGKEFSLHDLISPAALGALLVGGLLLSVLAGAYPAFVLSAYAPVNVLKGKLRDSRQGIRLRTTLVVAQFLISAILIVCTLMIGRQVDYVQSQNLGFDHRRLVSLTLDSASNARLDIMKARLSSDRLVTGATATYQVPIRITHGTAVSLKSETEKDRKILNAICVDSDFARVLDLRLAEGNGFTVGIDQQETQMEILLNQSAAAFFGWSNVEAVGKELNVWGSNGTVKGVVEDFRFNSVHSPVKPLIIFSGAGTKPSLRTLIVRVQGDPEEVRQNLTRAWSSVNPDSPLLLTHLEDQYASLYQRETRMKAIANIFSSLSILISLMGLFGLASYLISQRTKELGIRKVLGASFPGLIQLVSRDFIGMVVTAYALAAPISWLIMREWLSGFAEKIAFEWWIVAVAATGTTLLALGTIFYHAFSVSTLNPAETLRTD
jgi:putative ABC transport system permease protein